MRGARAVTMGVPWLLSLCVLACDGTPAGPLPVTSLVVKPAAVRLELGFTQEFTAVARDEGGAVVETGSIIWSTTNAEVVVVDSVGRATTTGPGGAQVVASVAGISDTAEVTVPPLAFVSIAPAYSYTCGVTDRGLAYCWGDNVSGQLGDGTRDTGLVLTPTPVAGGLRFQMVSARHRHTCGVTPSGEAYCWGWNVQGRLGDGNDTGHVLVPAPVIGGLTLASVHAGDSFTCGLTASGTAHCWGRNSDGSVGDGTTTDRYEPVAVSGDLGFAWLTTGGGHACGLTPEGVAYCWGANRFGQLGDGTLANRSGPVPVVGDLVFESLSAGRSHTCGVTPGGAAYCWGSNSQGVLGDGTEIDRWEPTAVGGGLTFRVVVPGGSHTCGLTTDSLAYCWGDNLTGQLGQPRYQPRKSPLPLPVTGGLRFEWLEVGPNHACGKATDGIVYCWGANPFGQLGIGAATIGSHEPVAIFGQR